MQETVAFLTLHFCSIFLGVSHHFLSHCTDCTAKELFVPLKLIKLFALVVIVIGLLALLIPILVMLFVLTLISSQGPI
jgi:sugar phosphate permease